MHPALLHIILWLFQLPGDFLSMLVPIVISAVTPFIVQWVLNVGISIFPTLKSWGVLVLLLPVSAGLVTFVSQLAISAGPTWYNQLIYGLLGVLVNEIWKAFKNASQESMGVGEKRKVLRLGFTGMKKAA